VFVEDETFSPPIEQLYQLTNSSFEPLNFKEECEIFSKYDINISDENYWHFRVYNKIALLVGINTEISKGISVIPKVSYAVMPFIWWESFMRSDHISENAYELEKNQYNQKYFDALKMAISKIGDPYLKGEDKDDIGFKYSIWRGENGILLLQQSSFDMQFGYDINYWIQPYTGRVIQPETPILEWLYSI